MDVHANWRMPARAFFTSNIDEVNLDLAWIFVFSSLWALSETGPHFFSAHPVIVIQGVLVHAQSSLIRDGSSCCNAAWSID